MGYSQTLATHDQKGYLNMADVSASAKNMQAVVEAKKKHNENCPLQGEAVRILMHAYDLERLGWEEGDTIAGLTIYENPRINVGMFKVQCNGEDNDTGREITEAVSSSDRDLVPA